MVNIFKKNKTSKSRDSAEAWAAEEPTFSRLVAGGNDRNLDQSSAAEFPAIDSPAVDPKGVDSPGIDFPADDLPDTDTPMHIPLVARLADIDPELREPVISGTRSTEKRRASLLRKSNPARESNSSNGAGPEHTGAGKGTTGRGHAKPRQPKPRQPKPRQQGQKPVSISSVQDESGDALPRFKTPPLDSAVRPDRPGDPIDSGSQAKLWEAFTPTKPKRWSKYFAGRRWAIQRVITAIEEEQAHVVIFGARGIGKTSLANVLAESASQVDYQVLRCPCSADITFEEIFRGFLRNLPSEFMDRSARAKNPAVEHFEQLLPRGSFGPTELTVALSFLKLEHVILIIDEFDRIGSETLKNQLAETIKNLSDIAARITFIVVGIAQNLEELIGKHPSIQRHLVAVHLPLMEPPELRALIEVGESASGMTFDDATREAVVSFAKGLPYYAQLMCLYSGRHALERGASSVEMRDLREAMAQVLEEADPVTVAMYDMATQGERNKFTTDVMFASARCRFDRFGAFTAADAADVALDPDERKLRELTLHKALSSLVLPQNGAVLEKTRTPSGITKYCFQHQTMRQYILVRQARQRGLI
jgi:ABC-type branched-subunit amino acid transport system ATPase component